MREIKFRGKDKNNNWVYGGIGHLRDIQAVIMEYAEEDFESYFIEHIVVPETISQFTGLYDKNGKEIFEGDIVLFNKDRNLPNYAIVPYVIKWHQGDCAFQRYPYNKELTVGGAGKLIQPDMMPECEIIGNIFDNPELLGE